MSHFALRGTYTYRLCRGAAEPCQRKWDDDTTDRPAPLMLKQSVVRNLGVFSLTCVIALCIAIDSGIALDLGLGAQVFQGAPGKTSLEQVAELQKSPSVKEACFQVRTPEGAEAVCRLTQLEALRLTVNRSDSVAYPGMSQQQLDKLKQASDSTEAAVEHLRNLSNLRRLRLSFLEARESPDRILRAVATLPALDDFELFWCNGLMRAQAHAEAAITIVVPPMRRLTSLKLSGSTCKYRFDQRFPMENLKSLIIDTEIPDQSGFGRLRNLRSLEINNFYRSTITDDGLKGLGQMNRLEQFTGGDAARMPLSSWRRLKNLRIADVSDREIEKISAMRDLTQLAVTFDGCSDAALGSLGKLTALRKLDIDIKKSWQKGKLVSPTISATGSGLAELAKCPDLTELRIGGIPASPALLAAVGKLKSLKVLIVSDLDHKLSVADAHFVKDLSNLEAVHLPWPPKQEVDLLRELSGWVHLKGLYLDNEGLADSQSAVLLNFPALETLHARNNKLTDASIETISKLKTLKVLKLGGNPIVGTRLDLLAAMPDLSELDLNRTDITDQTLLQHPLQSTSIRNLDLSGTKIAGAGLAALSSLSGLKHLGLAGTLLTDAGLANLHSDTLESVSVGGTEVTEHGIERLAELPELKTVEAHGCGIKYGAHFPDKPAVASQTGWYDYDYDNLQAREEDHKRNEAFIQVRLGGGSISEFDHQQRAETYRAIGEFKQSCIEYDQAIEELVHPKYHVCSLIATGHTHRSFECYDGRGMALAARGEYKTALDDLNKAVEIAHASAYARTHRGYVLMKVGRLDDALRDLDRAIDINPKLAAAYRYRSEVYGALGKEDFALSDLRASESLGYKPEFGGVLQDVHRDTSLSR